MYTRMMSFMPWARTGIKNLCVSRLLHMASEERFSLEVDRGIIGNKN